jgi:hypothetical protein
MSNITSNPFKYGMTLEENQANSVAGYKYGKKFYPN